MSSNGSADQIRHQALVQLLRTAEVIWNSSRILFERWDLSPSQFNVLNLLRFAPEGLSQTDLSRELLTHRSNVTGLIDRLEKRGLVVRCEAAADRRAYRVVLTDRGSALAKEIAPLYERGAVEILAHLPAKRASVLAEDLKSIADRASVVAVELQKKRQISMEALYERKANKPF